jgi:putative transposase
VQAARCTKSQLLPLSRKTDKPDDLTHQEMLEWIKVIAKFSDNLYGERAFKSIEYAELPVSRRKTAQLMKEAGV